MFHDINNEATVRNNVLMTGVRTLLGVLKKFSGMPHVGIGFVPFEPEFSALGVHVRFAKCERINVRLVFQVRQGMVDKPVGALVRTDSVYNVQQGCVGLETPVIFCYFWSRMVGPLREATFFDIFDAFLLLGVSGGGDHG